MIYRIAINLGLLVLGYYVGREVGRAEAVREQLRHARETGGSVYLGEVEQVHAEKVTPSHGGGAGGR